MKYSFFNSYLIRIWNSRSRRTTKNCMCWTAKTLRRRNWRSTSKDFFKIKKN